MMAGGTLAGAGESGGRTLIYLARHGQTRLMSPASCGAWPARRWTRPGGTRLSGWGHD